MGGPTGCVPPNLMPRLGFQIPVADTVGGSGAAPAPAAAPAAGTGFCGSGGDATGGGCTGARVGMGAVRGSWVGALVL